MKVQELVEFMKKNTNKTMKEDQVASLLKRTIEPKSYMSIKDKKQLVDKIVNKSIYYDNGIFKFDGIERYVYFTMYTIEAYTNLELSGDIEDDFDTLSESKLLPVIICLIQQEYDDVNIYLQMQCDYILEDNSVELQVGKFLNGILNAVDTFGSKISSYAENMDIEKLFNNSEMLKELINFANTVKE